MDGWTLFHGRRHATDLHFTFLCLDQILDNSTALSGQFLAASAFGVFVNLVLHTP